MRLLGFERPVAHRRRHLPDRARQAADDLVLTEDVQLTQRLFGR
jgi:hypothetical protein